FLRGGAWLRPHRAGRHLRAGLPAHRRGAGVRHPQAAEEDLAHADHRPLIHSPPPRARHAPMAEQATPYIDRLLAQFPEATLHIAEDRGEVTLELSPAHWHAACLALRDEHGFEQLVDLCGLDYL